MKKILPFTVSLLGIFSGTYLVSCLSSEFLPDFSSGNCGYRERDFVLLARALANGLNFFKLNLDQLNLDAGVGTRIVERQLDLILNSNPKISVKAQSILIKIRELSKAVSERIAEIHELKSPADQNMKVLPWITSGVLWRTPLIGEWKDLGDRKAWKGLTFKNFANATETLDEELSDTCIGQLFQNCQVTSACQAEFLTQPLQKYSLTHQVLFLHIAEQMSCTSALRFPGSSWREYAAILCSRVLLEAKAVEAEGFPDYYKDLFAEQVVVCSILGFQDFLTPTWMYEILFWQNQLTTRSACFPYYGDDKKDARKKRSEVVVELENDSGKCSVHFSAVGMAALALHMRHILETCIETGRIA